MNSSRTADEFDADVIASFGRHLLVRDAGGQELRARPSGRKLGIVCGDRVRCEFDRKHDESTGGRGPAPPYLAGARQPAW